jgi:hypothetical protein
MAGRISMGAPREVVSAVAGRYRPAKRAEKGRILGGLAGPRPVVDVARKRHSVA